MTALTTHDRGNGNDVGGCIDCPLPNEVWRLQDRVESLDRRFLLLAERIERSVQRLESVQELAGRQTEHVADWLKRLASSVNSMRKLMAKWEPQTTRRRRH